MAIEIVDLPIKNGDFPYSYVSLPEGSWDVDHLRSPLVEQLLLANQGSMGQAANA